MTLRHTLSASLIGGLFVCTLAFAGTTAAPRTPSTPTTPTTPTTPGSTPSDDDPFTARVVGVPACTQEPPTEEVCCKDVMVEGLKASPAKLTAWIGYVCGPHDFGFTYGESPTAVTPTQGKATFPNVCTTVPTVQDCPQDMKLTFGNLVQLTVSQDGVLIPIGYGERFPVNTTPAK